MKRGKEYALSGFKNLFLIWLFNFMHPVKIYIALKIYWTLSVTYFKLFVDIYSIMERHWSVFVDFVSDLGKGSFTVWLL